MLTQRSRLSIFKSPDDNLSVNVGPDFDNLDFALVTKTKHPPQHPLNCKGLRESK